MTDGLARIHKVADRAVGLGDYGREGQYIQRQIARWSSQYDLSRTANVEAMELLKTWLPANVPAGDETRLNHGAHRPGNTPVHPTQPPVIGVLAWELSTPHPPRAQLPPEPPHRHLGAGVC